MIRQSFRAPAPAEYFHRTTLARVNKYPLMGTIRNFQGNSKWVFVEKIPDCRPKRNFRSLAL